MIILIHVLIALSSIGFASYVFLAPSQAKFKVSYGLIAATLASGTYLVVSTHSPLLASCESGLVYLGIVSVATVAAHLRLARQHISID